MHAQNDQKGNEHTYRATENVALWMNILMYWTEMKNAQIIDRLKAYSDTGSNVRNLD